MKQRMILSDISPDFAREGQSQEEYLAKKKTEIIDFIKDYIYTSGAKGLVLGISGGVDSFAAGVLCAEASKELKSKLYLCLMPNKTQPDFKDAEDCAAQIKKVYDKAVIDTVSIGNGYEGALSDLRATQIFKEDPYVLGNVQARLRMVYQYALARGMLVVGTDHAAESVTGFYTKYGDGGVDIVPLQQLIKDDIYELSRMYDAPSAVLEKQPAAGLGISENDEQEMGVSYLDICSYLRGNIIDANAAAKIESLYERSRHKRALPVSLVNNTEKLAPATHIVVDGLYKTAGGNYMARSIAEYINTHPQHMVLYVQRGSIRDEKVVQDIFYTDVVKTVNSPIKRYNVFLGVDIFAAKNKEYGSLKNNIQQDVVLSGRWNMRMQETAKYLCEEGRTVTVLAYCIDAGDRLKYDSAHSEMEKLGTRMICNWVGGA